MKNKIKILTSILVVLFVLSGIILINSTFKDLKTASEPSSMISYKYGNYIDIKSEQYLKIIEKYNKNSNLDKKSLEEAKNLINYSKQYAELLSTTEEITKYKILTESSDIASSDDNNTDTPETSVEETNSSDVPEEVKKALEEEKTQEPKKRVLLKYEDNSEAMQILKDNVSLLSEKQSQLIDRNLLSISVPEGMTVEEVIDYYQIRDDISNVEEDYEVSICLVPNDTYYSSYQWNLKAVNADLGWDIAGGGSPGITVAVLDTGIAYENYLSYVKAKDFKSDTFVSGYDFVNNDSHPNDDHGHGTHVAGTIAQNTNNGFGCAGIASDVKIMPLKVLGASGSGSYSGIIAAIYYAVDNGADVINMSLGGGGYMTSARDAIKYAKNHNVVVVCAAGNSNSSVIYPAAYPESIAVGSVNNQKNKSSFSCYGEALDVVAPGEAILQETIIGGGNYNTSFYKYSGTSMATPHVAALAALIQSVYPGLSSDEVEEIIKSGCEDRGEAGFDIYYGHGLINIYNSVANDSTAPVITKFNINDDIAQTDTRFVTLNIDAYDLVTENSPKNYEMEMRFRNEDSDEWSSWENYSKTKNWILGDGEGTKTVFLEIRDKKLNQSESSDTIEYTGPEIPLISSVSPEPVSGNTLSIYNTLTVEGSGFGLKSSGQDKFLTFTNNIKVYSYDTNLIISWTDNLIITKVPKTAVTGPVSVTTKGGIAASDVSIDSVAPVISSFVINNNDAVTNSNEVTLSILADDFLSGCRFMSFKMGSNAWSEPEEYNPVKQYILDEPAGTKTVYVRVYDAAGNYSEKSDKINYYYQPEITSVSPDPASGLSSSASNTVIITGTSFGSSRTSTSFLTFSDGLKVSSTDKKKVLSWSNTQIKVKVPATAVTGDVIVTNFAGTSSPYAIVIDSQAPLIESMAINNNEAATTSTAVGLNITATDDGVGLKNMQFANSSKGPWSAPEEYSSSKSGWILSSGPGTKTVYVKIFDSAGNYTVKSASIKLVPEITQVTIKSLSTSSSSTSTNTVIITGLSFGASRVSSSYIYLSNGLKIYSTDKSKVLSWSDSKIEAKLPSGFTDGTITVVNKIDKSNPHEFNIDLAGPDILSFMINNGDEIISSREVVLSIEAMDNTTLQSLLKMRFKNESDSDFSQWEDYTDAKEWILSDGSGLKTVTVEIKDNSGNLSSADDTITFEITASEATEISGNIENDNNDENIDSFSIESGYAEDLLILINELRTDNDLIELNFNEKLSDIALNRSLDMLLRNYFSSETPEGKDIYDILDDNYVQYISAGENIAYIDYPFDKVTDNLLNIWLDSEKNRDNIFSEDFTKIGIGINSDGSKIIAVIVFIR